MHKIVTIIFVLIAAKAQAQIPEDAIKYSWLSYNGSARSTAIGGAIGSLGGDMSANFINPAGIGFYKSEEFSIGTLYNKINTKTNFRNFNNNYKTNSISLSTSGFVINTKGFNYNEDENVTKALSLAVTQKANFNNTVFYKGLNNYSSFAEQFVEEFVNSKLSIDQALNTQSQVPYTVAPALYTYLIDTVRINGKLKVKAAPEYILEAGQAIQQEFTKQASGGMYELAGTYAINNGAKLLGGVSIGVPIINFKSNTTVTEADTSSRTNNYFKSFTYNDIYTTKGAGFNVKFGLIYRPKDYIRLGLAFHTASTIVLTEERESSLKTNLENPIASFNINSKEFTNNVKGKATFTQKSPWKVIASGSYVFREVEDVTKQRGFISTDIEYLKHGGTKFSSSQENPTEADKTYYKQLSKVIKDNFKGAINVKIGGEVKFKTIMARAGFGYYSNPYKDAPSNAYKMMISGGLGYRNKGYFIDATYAYQIVKDFDVPYRLQNAETVFAGTKGNAGTILLTVGIKM